MRSGASSKAALWAGAAFILVLMVARLALAIVGVEHPFIWVLPLRADPFIVGALAALTLMLTLWRGALLAWNWELAAEVARATGYNIVHKASLLVDSVLYNNRCWANGR